VPEMPEIFDIGWLKEGYSGDRDALDS